MAWTKLGTVAPRDLVDTRLQVHWAAQVVASLGFTFAKPRPDWSHTSLAWNSKRKMLLGDAVGSNRTKAGLNIAALEIVLLSGAELSSFKLSGKTLEDAYAWLFENASGLDTSHSSLTLVRPEHEMPDHPISSGAVFNAPDHERAELSGWFNNASHVLSKVARSQSNASPVRCWPHHFDIATLISLDANADHEEARSIGVGMSPGDGGSAEPYFYVTPWPYPESDLLPPLPIGSWNVDSWVGGVLKGGILLAAGDAKQQADAAAMFIDAAVAASRRLLERT